MAQDAPDQSYYPRAKIRLIVRFEEFGKKVFTGKVPKKPAKNLDGVKDERAPLVVSHDDAAPAGVKRLLLLPKTSTEQPPVGGPQDQTGSDDGLTYVLGGIIPKEIKLQRNGIRVADTLTVRLRFVDCPVDPRVVRSCGVRVYFGTISASDYQASVQGRTMSGGDPILPDTYQDVNGDSRSNHRFDGFVDKWEVNWGDNSEPMIELTCRDNTSLMVDEDAPPGLVIDAKKPLDEAFADYLSHFPQYAGLGVEFRGLPGDTAPVLEDSLAKTAFRPNLGPPPAKGGGASGNEKLSVWDYLTDVVSSVGFSVRLEGNTVIIQKTRTLMSSDPSSGIARPDDPFKGRSTWKSRRWIYGRNVMSMKTSRSFTRSAPTNIEVRCYSPRRKKTMVGRFPSTGDTVADAKPGGIGADEKWKVFKVSGIEDENVLRIVAQNIYEQIGRNELEVSFKTRNLASFGGGNLDPDVLDMQAGDSFELLVNREEGTEFNTLTKIEKHLTIIDRSITFMKSLGFPEAFAAAYAKAYSDAGFQSIYKAKTIEFTWGDEGIEIEVVGVNYLEVRADALLNGT
jgi:hypothetical protein